VQGLSLTVSRRALFRAFLLVCIAWQALTLAGQMKLPMQSSEELGHIAAMHWSEKLHHHEEGGQLHQDASQQSVDHLAQDDLIDLSTLCPEFTTSLDAHFLTHEPPYLRGAPSSFAPEPLHKPPKLA